MKIIRIPAIIVCAYLILLCVCIIGWSLAISVRNEQCYKALIKSGEISPFRKDY